MFFRQLAALAGHFTECERRDVRDCAIIFHSEKLGLDFLNVVQDEIAVCIAFIHGRRRPG